MRAFELEFDSALHSADAIQRAAYRFCDRVSLELRQRDGCFVCVLTLLGEPETDDLVIADFRTEVLDQVLRGRIREQTEPVRNLILALAFSNTHLQEEE